MNPYDIFDSLAMGFVIGAIALLSFVLADIILKLLGGSQS